MVVRTLTEADLEPLWNLRLRALQDNPEAFSGTYAETFANGKEHMLQRVRPHADNFTLGAFENEDTLVGMVGFHREEGIKNRHNGRIISMYVVPEVRGHGVGKALLQEAIARAKHIPGVEQLHLAVVTTNPAARRLYLSLGFEVYGLVAQSMKSGNQYWDEELMVLRLV